MYEATACQITVTPAKAGVQSNCSSLAGLDARFRAHDE
jgi:hypothetical protein